MIRVSAAFMKLPSLLVLAVVVATAGCNTAQVRQTDPATETLVGNYVELGIEYMKQGQYDVALSRLQRALAIDSTSPEAHNAIALLYDRLEQTPLAEEHFRKAVDYDPQFAAAHNNYGTFLCRQGRHEAGEEHFLLAGNNTLNPNRDVAFTNAGLCMREKGAVDKAETYFRKALKINPRQPLALLAMARLSFEQQRYLPARAYLQRYAEVGTSTAESLWLGYRVESQLGDRNAASSYAVALRGRFPDSEEVRLLNQADAR